MATLSISRAWSEGSAFVRREGHLLFPIAFLLGSLPGAATQLLGPQEAPPPGQQPELGAWMLLMPLAIVLGFIANVAISYLALRPGISVGDALRRSIKRFLSMLGAALIVGIGAMVLVLIISTIAVMMVPGAAESINSGSAPSAEAMGSLGLAFLLLLIPALFFGTRLSLMGSVAAAEEVGPLGIIGRSWRLTSGRFWKILGFLLLFIISFVVVTLAIQFVLGSIILLVAGRPDPGSIAFVILVLLNALLSAIFYMFLAVTLARIYAQLTGDNVAEVFS